MEELPPHLTDAGHRDSALVSFDNNRLLPILFGQQGNHLELLASTLNVEIQTRGNSVQITGEMGAVQKAHDILLFLYSQAERGEMIDKQDVEAAVRMRQDMSGEEVPAAMQATHDLVIRTRKKVIHPRSHRQADYMQLLKDKELVFATGPAGTGKTYIAVAAAVAAMIEGKVDRLILSRPAVEAGEKLGFLPGDLKEKIDPYLRPLYDALHDMLPADKVTDYLETGVIEIAPLAFMRGRTLSNACVILDEAQNTTPVQMKMFLTRLGEGSTMVVTGDLSQIDLPRDQTSGLRQAMEILDGVAGIGIIQFTQKDVVRHALTARIIEAYQNKEQAELPLPKPTPREPKGHA